MLDIAPKPASAKRNRDTKWKPDLHNEPIKDIKKQRRPPITPPCSEYSASECGSDFEDSRSSTSSHSRTSSFSFNRDWSYENDPETRQGNNKLESTRHVGRRLRLPDLHRHHRPQKLFVPPITPPSSNPPSLAPSPTSTESSPFSNKSYRLHSPPHSHVSFLPSSLYNHHEPLKFIQSAPFWLALYFIFNLSLTLCNKGVLVAFPFPYTLTAIHAFFGSLGCWVLKQKSIFVSTRLTLQENLVLLSFSVLYTINIAVSNLSLQLVTVPFHQVVRASTPIFTLLISHFLLPSVLPQPTSSKIISLIPVILGVGLATYGDYYFTTWGLALTLFGTFLAALKTILTNLLQNHSSAHQLVSSFEVAAAISIPPPLHPLDLLMRMSPLAFIQCVFYAHFTGELSRLASYSAKISSHTGLGMSKGTLLALLVNGIIAFGLNVVSFTANKKAGALTMTVAANVKQVLTILLAVFVFNLTITRTNILGVFFTLVGGAWYAIVEYKEGRKKKMFIQISGKGWAIW